MIKPIKLFKLFGIEINIDYSWFIAFLLITLSLSYGYYPSLYKGLDNYIYLIFGIFSAIMLFLSVLLHELSHSIVAIKHGIPVRDIYLFIFGGVAMIEQEPESPKTEFKIAIAGPLMSFFLASIFFTIAYFYPKDDIFNGFINYLFFVNLALGTFNLIPAFPLDGGRIFRAILWNKYGILKATEIASKIGTYFGIFLIISGFFILISGNFLNGVWLIFLGFFIKKASKDALLQTQISVILSKIKVENIMKTMNPLHEELSLEEFLNYYYPLIETNLYPVLTTDGNILFLDRNSMNIFQYQDINNLKLKNILKPINYYILPDEKLNKAYNFMRKNNIYEIPVKYNSAFLGILRKKDIDYLIDQYLKGRKDEGPNYRR